MNSWRIPLPFIGTLLVAVFPLAGCSVAMLPDENSPTGTFRGLSSDDRPVRVTISETPQGFIGHGHLDGVPFSISFLSSHRGVGLLALDGNLQPLEVEMSLDGQALSLSALDQSLKLIRGDPDAATPVGEFNGLFSSGGIRGFIGELGLSQVDNLVLGTGNVFGRTFALSGIVDQPRSFRGRAVFVDGSEASVRAQLKKKTLTVYGFGGPIEFRTR